MTAPFSLLGKGERKDLEVFLTNAEWLEGTWRGQGRAELGG